MTDKETRRLEKLKSYNILDTKIDPSFDKIAKLASAICQTPIALISLIDHDRQWFKSAIGLEGVEETPRNISFCTYTIQNHIIMEIRDTLKDPRFMNNPLVLNNPKIRFYAGAPLTSPDGHNLGTLCVIDHKPNALNESQLEALKILALQVVELMELRKSNEDLIAAKKTLEDQQHLLINKARLQTIGELAGGVCHQINNPLAIIVGRSMILRSQLKQKLPEETEMLKELDVIDQTSQRVSGILKSLRMYSKDLGNDVSETTLTELLDDALTLMKGKLMKEKIELNLIKDTDAKLLVNKNQIGQVILDILSNSIEAMEESENKKIDLVVSADETNVYLKVSDTGKGIRQEDRDRIFEPFFTTKGRHFGVGLSNAVNFVRQHRGELKLLSLKNPTTFELQIPRDV